MIKEATCDFCLKAQGTLQNLILYSSFIQQKLMEIKNQIINHNCFEVDQRHCKLEFCKRLCTHIIITEWQKTCMTVFL